MQLPEPHAKLVDHLVQGSKQAIADIVIAQVIPEVFHRIKLRVVGMDMAAVSTPGQRAQVAVQRADGGQAVDQLPDDLLAHHRPQERRGPAAALVADAAKARLVLKQQAQPCPGGKQPQRLLEEVGDFFLNRSWARARAWGWRGRGPSLRQPCRCKRR